MVPAAPIADADNAEPKQTSAGQQQLFVVDCARLRVVCGICVQSKEIGIRVALGASMAQIGRAVIARGVALAVVGAAVGVVVAMWGTKLIEHELYGVTRSDLSSFVVGVSVLLAAATVACIVPMRHAVAVDPIRAIRTE